MATKEKAKTAAEWTAKTAGELGNTAYQALQDSLDAAAGAARLLRGDVSAESRESVHRIERLVRDAQRDLGRTGKQLLAELQALAESAAAGGPAAKRSPVSKAKPAATTRAAAAKAGATGMPGAARGTGKDASARAVRAKPAATPKAATTKAGPARSAPAAAKRGTKPASAAAGPTARRAAPAASKAKATRTNRS